MTEVKDKWGEPTEKIIIETNIKLVAGILDEIKTKKYPKKLQLTHFLASRQFSFL